MDSRSGAPQPEILPPGPIPGTEPRQSPPGWYPPPETTPRPPQPQRRRHWASAPATYWLVGINCAVFLAMVFTGSSIFAPTTRQILIWGGNNGTLVLAYGQWWRLITATFVHVGIIHLATNMWCLWNLGLLGEPLLGELGLFGTYLITGIAGNLLSVAVHPGISQARESIVDAGASGAVFGIAGVLLMLLRSPLLPIPPLELKKLRRSVWYFAIINLVIGIGADFAQTAVQIDNMAHLGGFLSGIALGFPLVPRIGAPRTTFLRRRAFTLTAMAFLLLLVAWGMRAYFTAAAS
jgi:rhomboid protease GluP